MALRRNTPPRPRDPLAHSQAAALGERLAALRQRHTPTRARSIAVASGVDGVGRATLVLNLAVALQNAGQRVLVVEAATDALGSRALLADPERPTLATILDGRVSALDAAGEAAFGVRLLSAAPGLDRLAALSPWQRDRLCEGFADLDAQADLALVDAPPETPDGHRGVIGATDELLVVAAPTPDATAGAYAVVKLAAARNPRTVARLVVNRAASRTQAAHTARTIGDAARRFLAIGVDYLGFVPEDPCVPLAGRRATPFVLADPASQAARCLGAIAARVRRPAVRATHTPLDQCMRQLSAFAAMQTPEPTLTDGAAPR